MRPAKRPLPGGLLDRRDGTGDGLPLAVLSADALELQGLVRGAIRQVQQQQHAPGQRALELQRYPAERIEARGGAVARLQGDVAAFASSFLQPSRLPNAASIFCFTSETAFASASRRATRRSRAGTLASAAMLPCQSTTVPKISKARTSGKRGDGLFKAGFLRTE